MLKRLKPQSNEKIEHEVTGVSRGRDNSLQVHHYIYQFIITHRFKKCNQKRLIRTTIFSKSYPKSTLMCLSVNTMCFIDTENTYV